MKKIIIHTDPLTVQCGDEYRVCRDKVDVLNAVGDLLDEQEEPSTPEKTDGQKLVEFIDRMMGCDPSPSEFSKTVDDHFWELGSNEKTSCKPKNGQATQ